MVSFKIFACASHAPMRVKMTTDLNSSIIRLRPRVNISDLSRGRTVLSTGLDGTIAKTDHRQGLYVYETRMLSNYRWLLDKKEPTLSASSAIEQHRWLGYYVALPPQLAGPAGAKGDPLQQTVELRIARAVGEGMLEAVELINHTQLETSFTLELDVAGDFTSHAANRSANQPKGRVSRHWHELEGWPQAWSASAPFIVLQALLGLAPYAPLETLLLDPWLPNWLPDVTLEHLRIGAATVTLRFFRTHRGETQHEVVALEGPLHIKHQPAPWSLLDGPVESVKPPFKAFHHNSPAGSGEVGRTDNCFLAPARIRAAHSLSSYPYH